MANVNAPLGLRPLRTLDGSAPSASAYSIAANYSTPIYQGDPVEMTGGADRNIQLAAAANQDNIGVFGGCSYVASDGTPKWSRHWTGETGATNIVAHVYDNPDTVFEIQADTFATADVGQLADWNAGTGSAATGQSGAYLVGGTLATTGKALRVLGLSRRLNNEYGAYAKLEVMFVAHVLRSVVSSVGGI